MTAASPRTVLLVDDEMEFANVLKSVLEDEGFKAIVTGDGTEALTALGEHKVDLILLDVMLPKLNGCEVLKKIREIEVNRTIPVILMSCVKLDAIPSELEWHHFLVKPFTFHELLSTVKKLCP
jgi:DNA-binding response OmpR family regulator